MFKKLTRQSLLSAVLGLGVEGGGPLEGLDAARQVQSAPDAPARECRPRREKLPAFV
jgi:hypothetical protein